MSTTQNDKDLARLMAIADEFKRLAKIMHDNMFISETISPDVTKVLDDWILELCSPAAKLNADPSIRPIEEIQKAHDVFGEIAHGQIKLGLPAHILAMTHACADLLCWILKHEHGPDGFQKNYDSLLRMAEERGYKLTRV